MGHSFGAELPVSVLRALEIRCAGDTALKSTYRFSNRQLSTGDKECVGLFEGILFLREKLIEVVEIHELDADGIVHEFLGHFDKCSFHQTIGSNIAVSFG